MDCLTNSREGSPFLARLRSNKGLYTPHLLTFTKVGILGFGETWRLVGYCGIYCGECITYRVRIITMSARELKGLIEVGSSQVF